MKRLLFLLSCLLLAVPAAAQLNFGAADNLLEPEKAFRFSARALDAATVEVSFRIADGWPSARLGSIEVRPIDEGLRLDRRYA